MSFDLPVLPHGWAFSPLEDCAVPGSISYGVVQPGSPVSGGVPIIRVNNFGDMRLDLSDVMHIAPEVEAKHARTRLSGGEVLLTLVGSVGQVAEVPMACDGFNVARAVGVIKPANGIDAKWIAICLRSPLSQHLLGSRANTTVQTTINLKDVRALPIPVPPMAERKLISDFVAALDDRVTLLRETNATLEAIAQALFKSWFVDFDPVRAKSQGLPPAGMDEATAALFPDGFEESSLGPIPSGWQVKRIEDAAEKVGMGPFGSNIKVSTFVEEGTPVISGGHLHNTLLEDLKFNYITDEHAMRLKNSCVVSGDVVFTHAGSIGQVSLIPKGSAFSRYVLSQRQFYLRCNREFMQPTWMVYFFRSPQGQHLLLANASQVGVPSIARPVSYLRSIQFVLPPTSIVERFSDVVDGLHARVVHNRKQAQALTSLRDTLLPRLISGQLRLPEAAQAVEEFST